MGLDMYLRATKYVGDWDFSGNRREFDEIKAATGIAPTEDAPAFHVSANVGYWRKANAIHRWFVENVQGGVDECQESSVSREELKELLALCNEVLAVAKTAKGKVFAGIEYSGGKETRLEEDGEVVTNAEEVAKILPAESGFFFGCTDYDSDYMADVRGTKEIIERVLADETLKGCDFTYQASW